MINDALVVIAQPDEQQREFWRYLLIVVEGSCLNSAIVLELTTSALRMKAVGDSSPAT